MNSSDVYRVVRYKTVKGAVRDAMRGSVEWAAYQAVDEAVRWASDRTAWMVTWAVDEAKDRSHPLLEGFLLELQECGAR